jgi:hypothetical protein
LAGDDPSGNAAAETAVAAEERLSLKAERLQGVRIKGSLQPRPGRCGSRLRKSRPPRYCQRHPLPGRTRCALHGGASPRGVASPHFVHGLRARAAVFDYAAVLGPTRLGAHFRAAAQQPDPLSTKQQIALYEARVALALEQIAQDEALPKAVIDSWREVTEARTAAGRAQTDAAKAAANARLAAAINAHGEAMTGAARAHAAQAELDRTTVVLDRLKRTELELQETRFRAFTAEQAFALIGSLAALVKGPVEQHVPDLQMRRSILRDVAAGLAALAARKAEPTALGSPSE